MITVNITEPQPLILYQTSLMELIYDAQTDIMRVKWADFEDLNWLEVEYNFRVIRDSIKWYFIKRILVDASAFCKMPDKALLHQVTCRFAEALYGTSIRKVARLQCGSPQREALALEIYNQLDPSNYFLEFQTFTDEEEAVGWLQGNELSFLS